MPSTLGLSSAALGWPEDAGWLLVGDRCPDPVDAVYDVDGGWVGWDASDLSDAEALDGAGEASVWDLPLLASIDPRSLDREGQVAFLRRSDAVDGVKAAQKMRAIVAIAGAEFCGDSVADRHLTMEVALALRIGEGAAASQIAVARALHTDFPDFLDALGRGEVSEWHVRELVSGTRHVTDPHVLAALQDRLLPKAKRRTPGQFRTDIRKAVADLDAERAAERVARARAERFVSYRPLDDGMAFLGIVTDQPTAFAMFTAIDTDARAAHQAAGGAAAVRAGDDDASMDACRADAFATRVLGRLDADGTLVWDRSEQQVTLTLVMSLDTLREESERCALLDGEPIPAAAAREYADAARTWRRAVTDPVTGHLLDYGREQYLPQKLRDLVLARDLCRAPGCTRRAASRLEMDHAVPFPEGGTSAPNCGGLCVHHHQLKTAGLAHIEESAPDGSAVWVTGFGQRIRIEPRPFLHDPLDDPPEERESADPVPPSQSPPMVVQRPRSRGGFDPRELDVPDEPPF
ncbi:MAG: DUF222 domain-containing protein [Candidatus Nanopelagicales bacterium]